MTPVPDDIARLQSHVAALCGAATRYWNTAGFAGAMEYAEAQLRGWGYAVRRQPFEIGARRPRVCHNLIVDPPARPVEEPPAVIVGAHLDSIAPEAKSGGPAPGADDNASGCALVLEAARRLARPEAAVLVQPGEAAFLETGEGRADRVRFILFGAEEIGLYGSQAYVNSMFLDERRALEAVWVLDQVGLCTRPEPTLKLEGYKGRSGGLMERAEAAAPEAGLRTVRTYRPYGSDHMPFLRARVPSLLLIQPDDEEDPLNHTDEDLPGRLSYDYMARILQVLTTVAGD